MFQFEKMQLGNFVRQVDLHLSPIVELLCFQTADPKFLKHGYRPLVVAALLHTSSLRRAKTPKYFHESLKKEKESHTVVFKEAVLKATAV